MLSLRVVQPGTCLVCLPNKPWLGIRISPTSSTHSGKQTKVWFGNLNFLISALQASSARGCIYSHRAHFCVEVAKYKMLSGLMWLLPSATPNYEACNIIGIKSTPTEPYRSNPGFFYVFPVLSPLLSPPPAPTSHGYVTFWLYQFAQLWRAGCVLTFTSIPLPCKLLLTACPLLETEQKALVERNCHVYAKDPKHPGQAKF